MTCHVTISEANGINDESDCQQLRVQVDARKRALIRSSKDLTFSFFFKFLEKKQKLSEPHAPTGD